MKKILTAILIIGLLAAVGFIGYNFFIKDDDDELTDVNGDGFIDDNDKFLPADKIGSGKNESYDYSNAYITTSNQTSVNKLCSADGECVNYVGDKVNLTVSFTIDNQTSTYADTIFSFKDDLKIYDEKTIEEQSVVVNGESYKATLKNANSNSVTLNVSNVILTKNNTYELSNVKINVYQLFTNDNSVSLRKSFDTSSLITKWIIEVNEEIVEVPELTTSELGTYLSSKYETEDYSYLDHTGFDGKLYTHTNMSLKSDAITLKTKFAINEEFEESITTSLLLNNKEFAFDEVTSVDNYYIGTISFKYSDINSENIKITGIKFKTSSTNQTVKLDEELINKETFTFYDGTYSDISSMLTKAEQEYFMLRYSNDADTVKLWDGSKFNWSNVNYAGHQKALYGLNTNKMLETKEDIRNLQVQNSSNVYGSCPWYIHAVDINNLVDGECEKKVVYDPYVIKGNWLVTNNILVEHLGGLNNSVDVYNPETEEENPLKHGKPEINLFNHDCVLDGYFNFDGYSIQYGDLESDYIKYGSWEKSDGTYETSAIRYETFDYAFDTYNIYVAGCNDVENCNICETFVPTSPQGVSYGGSGSNVTAFGLFQKITENGKFANCYIDYSKIPDGLGEKYAFLGIEENHGVVENIKTEGQNLVWFNFGKVRNIEQNTTYFLNKLWAEEEDYFSVESTALFKYNSGSLVYYNDTNGIVENVKTTLKVKDSPIQIFTGWFEIANGFSIDESITASTFNASEILSSKVPSGKAIASKWSYGTVSCVSLQLNRGIIKNATISYEYNGTQDLNGTFKAFSIEEVNEDTMFSTMSERANIIKDRAWLMKYPN